MSYSKPLHAPLVFLQKAFQDEIVTPSGLKLFLDGSYNRNFTATVTGTIAALPILGKNKKEQAILDQLKIGDEIAMSYLVVYDLNYDSDGNRFMATTEGNEMMRQWVNAKGDKIDVVALPGKIWVGYLTDVRGNYVDGQQGNQGQVETWLSQFPLGKTDKFTFNNLFNFNGVDYWKCELDLIFAKKVKGHLVAVGDNIICQPIDEEIPDYILRSMESISDDVKVRYQDRAMVLTDGTKTFKKGQVVAFNPLFVQKYEFWGKEYYIINKSRVHGLWHNKAIK